MHAIFEIRLSAPWAKTRSVKSPTDAPPDSGRMSASGRISAGISKGTTIGDKRFVMNSIAPDARSIADTDIIATRGGKIDIMVFIPSPAPSIKQS